MSLKKLIFYSCKIGSSRIKNKNLKKINGKTLLEISIKKCLKTKLGDVVVSTDSKIMQTIVKKKIYYLREKNIQDQNHQLYQVFCII